MKIIESSQFLFEDYVGKDFDIEAEKIISMNSFRVSVIQVEKYHSPSIGTVWLSKGEDGKCRVYAYNFDSSD